MRRQSVGLDATSSAGKVMWPVVGRSQSSPACSPPPSAAWPTGRLTVVRTRPNAPPVARPGLEVHLWVSSPKAEVSLNVSVTAQSGRKVAAVYAQTNPVTDVLVAVPKPVPYFDSSFKELKPFVPSPGDNDPIPPPPQHYYELTKAAQISANPALHSGTCSGNFRCRPVRCPGHRTY